MNEILIYRTYHQVSRPQHRKLRPLLLQCVGSLTSHKVIMNKGCETGPTIYRPYPRRLDSLTICRQHFLLSYLKTLSVGPTEVWTRDLPHGSPVLYQLIGG